MTITRQWPSPDGIRCAEVDRPDLGVRLVLDQADTPDDALARKIIARPVFELGTRPTL